MSRFLSISVGDQSTHMYYVVDNEVIVAHTHPHGIRHMEAEGLGRIAGSKLLDGVQYLLEFISLHDRIPTDIRLLTPRYQTWLHGVIQNASYTQFFTDGVAPHVTLENSKDLTHRYAGHTKTILSFKI